MKINFLSIVFCFFVFHVSAQKKNNRTDSLSWCKCNTHYSLSSTGIRTTSACEKILYDSILNVVTHSLEKLLADRIEGFVYSGNNLINDKISSEVKFSKNKILFDISSFYSNRSAPTWKWKIDKNSELNKMISFRLDSISTELKQHLNDGTYSSNLSEHMSFLSAKLLEQTYVTISIYTNRTYKQEVNGKKAPLILSNTSASQAYRIPFSSNRQTGRSMGLGTTKHETVLLYGVYKTIALTKNKEGNAFNIGVELKDQSNESSLSIHGLEIRFEGNQEVVDKMIKLIAHEKILKAVERYSLH